jgi:hypothetical protein
MRKASFAVALAASFGLVLAGGSFASASPGATGAECPAGAAAITGLSFTVNGQPASTSGLVINGVMPGAVVVASFTVAPGCTAVPLNFSAYNAVAAVANAGNVGAQTLRSNASGTFGAGAHTLSIVVPNCFFQIDLYRGALVSQWDLLDLLSFSGNSTRQMLGNATGGSTACQSNSGGTTITVTPPVTTSPPPSLAVIPTTPSTPTVVAGVQTSPAPAAALAAPAPAQSVRSAPVANVAGLPSTSTTSRSGVPGLDLAGLGFILLGAAMLFRRAAVAER